MSFHTAGSPQGGRACAHTRVGTTCGRWVRSGGPGGPRRPVPLVPLWPSSPPHPHSPSGLCPDVGTAQGPLGSLTKAGRMWGRPWLEGQEGSLSGDNRWKGRRSWEPQGFGRWPEDGLRTMAGAWAWALETSGSGTCIPLSSRATAAPVPTSCHSGIRPLHGRLLPTASLTLAPAEPGVLSQAYLAEGSNAEAGLCPRPGVAGLGAQHHRPLASPLPVP